MATLPRSGSESVSAVSQALPMPSMALHSTISISLANSAGPFPIKPTAGAPAPPAHSSHTPVIIGVVIGVTCILLLSVLAAAACCSTKLRQKLRFRRYHDDALSRCDSVATTLTAGSASISIASSATVVETTHEANGVQTAPRVNSVRGDRSSIVPRDMRIYESYEMNDLRPGYSAGGFLSAI